MLMMLRERMKGVVAGVIVTLMAVVFALFGLQYYLTSSQSQPYVAKVNGERIGTDRFNHLLKLQQDALQGTPAAHLIHEPAYRALVKKQVLSHMVGQRLYQQAIAGLPLMVSDQSIQAQLMKEPMFLHHSAFSKELYEQFLAQSFLTSDEFLKLTEWQLKEKQVSEGITQSAWVFPDELSLALDLYYQQRDVGYFALDPKPLMAQQKVDSAEIKKYYKDHASQFVTPERIKLSYVLLDANVLKKNIKIDDAELKRLYTSEADQFEQPAQLTYSMVAWPVPAGASHKDWEAAQSAMQTISHDWKAHAGSASWLAALQKKNHRLGITRGKTMLTKALPAYAQHLALAQAGQVTAPMRIDTGVVVMRLDAKHDARKQSYAQVAPRLKARLLNQKAIERFSESSEQLADDTYTHPSSLDVASQRLKLPIRKTGWLTRQDALTQLHTLLPGNTSLVQQAAFGEDVLKLGNNSRVLQLQDGVAMVIRVAQHQASQAQAYSPGIAAQIEQILRADKAREAMRKDSDQLLAALRAGQSPVSLAKKYKLVWHRVNGLSMQEPSTKLGKNLISAAFSMRGDPKHTVLVSSVPMADQSQVVLQVLAFHQPAVTAKQRADMAARLTQLHADMSMAVYLEPVLAKAKISLAD